MSDPQPYPPQAPPRRGHMARNLGIGCLGLLLLLVVVVVVVIVLAAGGDDDAGTLPTPGASSTAEVEGDGDPLTSPEPEPSVEGPGGAADDITVTSCAEGDAGFWAAGLTIVASAEKTSTYVITVGVLAADGSRVGTLLATAEAISPGQTANVEALGTVTEGAVGATCQVVDVERFSS